MSFDDVKPAGYVIWKHNPTGLELWQKTYSKCGEWQATRTPNGVIYTQWRYVQHANEWEPFFSVLVAS